MPPQDTNEAAPPSETEPTIRFRPSKKRKIYRQRATSPPTASPTQTPEPAASVSQRATAVDFFDEAGNKTDDETVEPTVIRAATRTSTRRGVGFRSSARPQENDYERSLVVREEERLPVEDRFVKHSGARTVVDDKHMNAFIESRLSASRGVAQRDEAPSAADEEPQIAKDERPVTTHGNQIQEVDLPQAPSREDGPKIERPKKVRLGPDGKPWRGGRRKRRGSDDVARDRLVEEFLHENRLDVYDHPAKAADEEADGDADERVAAQFKQQYMEDVARKQQKQKAAQQKQQQEGEVLKGPKLGGSRNDRAAIREALLKTQREGQK